MAPVAGGIAGTDQKKLVFPLRPVKRVITPLDPVNGVVLVLAKVRAGGGGEGVGHGKEEE
jgi:hypothetical protein